MSLIIIGPYLYPDALQYNSITGDCNKRHNRKSIISTLGSWLISRKEASWLPEVLKKSEYTSYSSDYKYGVIRQKYLGTV